MAAIYQQMPIRLQANLVSAPPVNPIDANTGLRIKFWRAQGVTVQVGIFDAYGDTVDLSNLEYLQLLVQPTQGSLIPSIVSTVYAADIIPVINSAGWNAGTAAQAAFVLTNADTDLSLDGETEATYWLSLIGRTNGGANIVYAAGPVTIYNPGLPPQPPVAFVSAHTQTNGGGDSVVNPTSQVHLEQITFTGSAGIRNVVVQAAGLIKGAKVGVRLVLPSTAGIIVKIYNQALVSTVLATVYTQSDGTVPTSRIELWFDGANLQPDFMIQPAFSSGVASSGVDPSISSLANLAAIPTTVLTPPVIKVWIESTDLLSQTWILKAGTDATIAGSVQRPDDFNPATNAKVWYRAG